MLAVLVLLAAVTPSPYVVMRPGPTVDVLSELQGEAGAEPVIDVDSETHESDGALRLVTVSMVGSPEKRVKWLTAARVALDPTQQLVPLEQEFADDRTVEDRAQQNAALMDRSQRQAAAAAFASLEQHVPATLTVNGVMEDGPSEGVLEEGDVIIEIAGAKSPNFPKLRELIAESGENRALELLVERGGEQVPLEITPQVPVGGGAPMIGALIDEAFELPHGVDFTLSNIGGPSAGLVFALGLYEMMTPGSLLAGQDVSGTGTIDSAGNVGPIDGLAQKLWAAERDGSELFLMPLANCEMVPDRTPSGLAIAPVATLDEAIEAVEVSARGGEVAGLERCDDA